MTDRSQVAAAVRSRSWDWLFALRKRLNVDLQLVDDGLTPLLTVSGSPGAAVDSALSGGVPGVRLAATTAIRTRTPQAASVDRLQMVVVPVTHDRVVSGALLVARRTGEDAPVERVRSELELVGFWLTNAIEAHLQSPPAGQGDLDRVSALCQLLADRSGRRSDREIVAAFIETLAVWHDLEAYGYVETTREEYARESALPGADLTRTPSVFSRAALPELSDPARLTKSDTDRLGFSGSEDVVLARIGQGVGSWLIAITGSIQGDELPRLTLYISLLDQAVARAIQSTTARVLATLSAHLLVDAADLEAQARQAVQELRQALGMSTAALTVTTRTGAALLHVAVAPGQAEAGRHTVNMTAADLAEGGESGKVVIIRREPQLYSMAFVGAWTADHRVTQQENHVAQAAGELFESWVRRVVHQSARVLDRRAPGRSFDEVLERAARDAVQGGIPVTAIVISFGDATFRPEVTQARVVRLREHLRGGDLVGRLGEGEVGLLLRDTAAPQAALLVARLRGLLEREGVPRTQVAIGMATRTPGESMGGAMTQQARQSARHDGSDN